MSGSINGGGGGGGSVSGSPLSALASSFRGFRRSGSDPKNGGGGGVRGEGSESEGGSTAATADSDSSAAVVGGVLFLEEVDDDRNGGGPASRSFRRSASGGSSPSSRPSIGDSVQSSLRLLRSTAAERAADVKASVEKFEARCDEKLEELEARVMGKGRGGGGGGGNGSGSAASASGGGGGGIAEKLADSLPKMELPKMELPSMELPKIEVPKLEVPKLEVPKLEVPKVDMSKLSIRGALGGSGSTPKKGNSGEDEGEADEEGGYSPVKPVTIATVTDPATSDVYEGPVDAAGIRHGEGAVVHFADGAKFLGRYVNDAPREGTLKREGGETYRGPIGEEWTYDTSPPLMGAQSDSGEVAHRKKEGMGTLTKPDGTTYVGGFRRGLYHGAGKLTMPDGTMYEGMFTDGDFDGRGELRRADGTVYVGTWRDGRKEGEGMETVLAPKESLAEDETRVGGAKEARQQQRHEIYEGQFRDGIRAGSGKLVLPNGTFAEGWWRRGQPADGPGWTIVYPNGDRYYGKATDLVPDGMGTMRYAESPRGMYSGEWRGGKRHGRGMRVYEDKTKEEGLWEDDALVVPDEAQKPLISPSLPSLKGKEVGQTCSSVESGPTVVAVPPTEGRER